LSIVAPDRLAGFNIDQWPDEVEVVGAGRTVHARLRVLDADSRRGRADAEPLQKQRQDELRRPGMLCSGGAFHMDHPPHGSRIRRGEPAQERHRESQIEWNALRQVLTDQTRVLVSVRDSEPCRPSSAMSGAVRCCRTREAQAFSFGTGSPRAVWIACRTSSPRVIPNSAARAASASDVVPDTLVATVSVNSLVIVMISSAADGGVGSSTPRRMEQRREEAGENLCRAQCLSGRRHARSPGSARWPGLIADNFETIEHDIPHIGTVAVIELLEAERQEHFDAFLAERERSAKARLGKNPLDAEASRQLEAVEQFRRDPPFKPFKLGSFNQALHLQQCCAVRDRYPGHRCGRVAMEVRAQGRTEKHFLKWKNSGNYKAAVAAGAIPTFVQNLGIEFMDDAVACRLSIGDIANENFSKPQPTSALESSQALARRRWFVITVLLIITIGLWSAGFQIIGFRPGATARLRRVSRARSGALTAADLRIRIAGLARAVEFVDRTVTGAPPDRAVAAGTPVSSAATPPKSTRRAAVLLKLIDLINGYPLAEREGVVERIVLRAGGEADSWCGPQDRRRPAGRSTTALACRRRSQFRKSWLG
ncbi:hypothetical protein JKP88DRAFT_256031, partial [Tribonema minus]